MILGVFIEFFGVKIVIGLSKNNCNLIITIGFDLSQNSRYLLIFYRYLPIFYRYLSIYLRYLPIYLRYLPIYLRYLLIFCRYFFRHSNTYAREIKSRNLTEISGISDISAILSIFL